MRKILSVFLFLLASTLLYASYQDGLDAGLKGDYETALKIWQPLAEQGDIDAQYSLGWMYEDGSVEKL